MIVNAGYGGEIGYSWIFPTTTGYYIGLGVVRPPVDRQRVDKLCHRATNCFAVGKVEVRFPLR